MDLLERFAATRAVLEAAVLGPGDAIVMYTDGVTDAWHPPNEDYGVDRLTAALAAAPQGARDSSHISRLISTPVPRARRKRTMLRF